MLAFREAIRAGTEAIETDIHLTKDHVAVLSHVWTELLHLNRLGD